MALTVGSIVAGIALALIAAGDIILTIFAPSARGIISPAIMRGVWRIARPYVSEDARRKELVGPVIFLAVLVAWAGLMALGFALIYWRFLPEDFLLDSGLDIDPDGWEALLSALYFSIVVLATLGFGDIVPTSGILRLIVPLQALVGFGVLTAAISYVLSIDPALSRRRILSQRISIVREADEEINDHWDAGTASEYFKSFANEIISVRSDQVQLPITYYFRDADPTADLSGQLPFLLELVRRERDRHREKVEGGEMPSAVYINQHLLERAIHDYLSAVNREFLRNDANGIDEMMRAYVEDHK